MLVQRSILSLGLAAVLAVAGVAAADCPPIRPVLSGPSLTQTGLRYTLTWTNVLGDVVGAADYYTVERSLDSTFAAGVDRVRTSRPALSLTAPGAPGTLYHRVVVSSSCPTVGFAVNASNVVPVKVTTDCLPPEPLGELVVTPEAPPGFTTYVVAWDDSGIGAGAGGGPTGLRFRIRRVTAFETKESVSESSSTSFTDPPGEYVYQVRAEASCGALGPWSPAKRVVVGNAPGASLVLLSEAKPIAAVAPLTPPSTAFIVRNGGTKTLNIKASLVAGSMHVAPESFTIGPNQAQTLTVTLAATALPSGLPVHGSVELSGDGAYLKVPVDAAIAAAPSGPAAGAVSAPVYWNDGDLEVNAGGDEVLRSIVNPQATAATIVSSIRVPWIAIESLDGEPWDRPLRPLETRTVRVRIDRGARRAASGTETGVVSLVTAGVDESARMVVVDDGPRLAFTAGDRPISTDARTRILYASIPNARAASGDGRFTSDLWLTNMDAVSSINVSIYLTPHHTEGTPVETRHVDLTLAPGEIRRYRNIVGAVGFSGACEMEVRSVSSTLSATALVNKLSEPVAASSRGALAGASPAVGLSEFEMRPVQPGQGVSAADTPFVLSGLRHDAKRSTNLILTETTGNKTTVRIALFRGDPGRPVLKDGKEVVLVQPLEPLGTVQINDDKLFDPAPIPDGVYATIDFVEGVNDGFGSVRGAVMPMATVTNSIVGKALLRVGVSRSALTPLPVIAPEAAARRDPLVTLPFGGKAAPLVFPVVHLRGAPLTSGQRPNWRTRVSFTNVSDVTRDITLTFVDSNGEQPKPAWTFTLGSKTTLVQEDLLEDRFAYTVDENVYGVVMIDTRGTNRDGSIKNDWTGVDVQTETYTPFPGNEANGDLGTGMEGFSYLHGYSSFQSNLGAVQLEGAENSSRYRTNLVLQETGGNYVTVAVSAYKPGSFVPIAVVPVQVPPFGYISKELFKGYLGLDLTELTDVRVVVRQISGDGVFMAFASRVNLTTGDPANVFLRPASAGTGR